MCDVSISGVLVTMREGASVREERGTRGEEGEASTLGAASVTACEAIVPPRDAVCVEGAVVAAVGISSALSTN